MNRRPPPAAEAPLGSSEVLAEYASSLQRLAQNEAAAANPSTSAAAAAVSSEFCSWLAARSLARRITLQTCTPEDVAVFFESHWLPKHGSSLLEDGAVHAAPSYLASTVSHLRGFFKRLGRDGQFSHATQTGNPCCDDLITKLTSTYHQQCWQQGYAEKSAKSLTFEQYDELTAGLHREVSSLLTRLAAARHTPTGQRFKAAQPLLLLLRDAVAITAAWESAVRGHNACILQGEDLQDRRGSSLLTQLLQHAEFPYAAGFRWQLAPNGTKARQARRAGSLPLEVLPADAEHRDMLRLVHMLLQVHQWVGLPTNSYLVRPLADDHLSFKAGPLSTSAFNKQLQHHLRRLGLFQGESTHGLRRGTVIHDHQQLGRTPAEAGLRLQHANPGGPQTLQYLDTSRESGGPPKQRRRLS
ncbi:hypothetical protein ABPG75_002969 [Micractinium tetrahymenae]